MHRHPPSQVELLKADIDRLRDERASCLIRRDQAETAKHQAQELVAHAAAAMTNAEVSAGVLALQIDSQLEALSELLPKPREDDCGR